MESQCPHHALPLEPSASPNVWYSRRELASNTWPFCYCPALASHPMKHFYGFHLRSKIYAIFTGFNLYLTLSDNRPIFSWAIFCRDPLMSSEWRWCTWKQGKGQWWRRWSRAPSSGNNTVYYERISIVHTKSLLSTLTSPNPTVSNEMNMK